MSHYLILLFILMSACTTSHEEGSTPSVQTRSASADSPSETASATSSPTLTPTRLASATRLAMATATIQYLFNVM